jgi:hypothetical protein
VACSCHAGMPRCPPLSVCLPLACSKGAAGLACKCTAWLVPQFRQCLKAWQLSQAPHKAGTTHQLSDTCHHLLNCQPSFASPGGGGSNQLAGCAAASSEALMAGSLAATRSLEPRQMSERWAVEVMGESSRLPRPSWELPPAACVCAHMRGQVGL